MPNGSGRAKHGGNTDIKNLSMERRIYFLSSPRVQAWPWVLHFSQGDGEIAFCGAIEMDGIHSTGLRT